MIFLFSIFAQWFSRGVFLQIFFQQEDSLLLIAVLFGAVALSSPIQGRMSDLTSRKKVILMGLAFTIASLLIVFFAPQTNFIKLPIILGIAAVLNGVFGNVFPASGAAFSERTKDQRQSMARLLLCRYLGMGIGFILPLPQIPKLIFATTLAVIALLWVLLGVEDRKITEKGQKEAP